MAKQIPFHIKSGLPFGKSIVVTLPTERDWWTSSTDFEVLSQIREASDYTSPLLLDLAQFITKSFSVDTVTIDLEMTGADTRLLTQDGYYDVILSDPFAVDDLAIVIIGGPVYRTAVVTDDTEAITI